MTPTNVHLALLQQLPRPVLTALQQHGPGWAWVLTPTPVLQSVWSEYRASCDSYSVGWWLPCNPLAIMEVATQLASEVAPWFRVGWVATNRGDAELYSCRLYSGLRPMWTGRSRQSDAHEMALSALLELTRKAPAAPYCSGMK